MPFGEHHFFSTLAARKNSRHEDPARRKWSTTNDTTLVISRHVSSCVLEYMHLTGCLEWSYAENKLSPMIQMLQKPARLRPWALPMECVTVWRRGGQKCPKVSESVRLEDGQKQNEARLPVPRLVDQNGFRIAHPTSSRMAFFTWVGTGAYLRGSMTLLAR